MFDIFSTLLPPLTVSLTLIFIPIRFYNEWCTCYKKVCRSFYLNKRLRKRKFKKKTLWYVIYSKHNPQTHTIIITNATMSKEKRKTKRFQVFLHASHQDMFSFNFSHFKRTFCDKHEKEIHAVKPFSQL